MKTFQKTLIMLLAAAFLLILPSNTISVQADDGAVYVLKYIEEYDELRYKEGNGWDVDEDADGRELYYLMLEIKDGDHIVIEGGAESGSVIEQHFPVTLGSLTTIATYGITVVANGIENCYILGDTVTAVTCDVTNAYVYNNAVVSFIGNVNYMEINQTYVTYRDSDENDVYTLTANVNCSGTVNHLVAQDVENGVHYEFYNFVAGTLEIVDGELNTSSEYFSETASTTTTGSTATTTTTTTASTTATKTYTVKKGDSLWKIAYANLGSGTRYTEIKTLSNITSNTIYVGQVLTLPAQ